MKKAAAARASSKRNGGERVETVSRVSWSQAKPAQTRTQLCHVLQATVRACALDEVAGVRGMSCRVRGSSKLAPPAIRFAGTTHVSKVMKRGECEFGVEVEVKFQVNS